MGKSSSKERVIFNAELVTGDGVKRGGVQIDGAGRIARIFSGEDCPHSSSATQVIDAQGAYLLPGAIDSHVHFREPGLTAKGDIYTESAAAVAGGVTSFIDMPNTLPPTVSMEALQAKFESAENRSFANYGFYLAATASNLDLIAAADPCVVPGIKLFMGGSTGDMQINEREVVEEIFARVRLPLLTHCETDSLMEAGRRAAEERYGEAIPPEAHAAIRSAQSCLESTQLAYNLAKKYGTRLHVLHLSTREEGELFARLSVDERKRITAEICPHYLYWDSDAYARYGAFVKCNPAIKGAEHRNALLRYLEEGVFYTIGTDHAPHLLEEKNRPFFNAPSGISSVQFGLLAMLELAAGGHCTRSDVVRMYCEHPASLFRIRDRGFLREGYWADLALVGFGASPAKGENAVLSRCGWSPFADYTFSHRILATFVNGAQVWDGKKHLHAPDGRQLRFAEL